MNFINNTFYLNQSQDNGVNEKGRINQTFIENPTGLNSDWEPKRPLHRVLRQPSKGSLIFNESRNNSLQRINHSRGGL